jgi:hypothetical protein
MLKPELSHRAKARSPVEPIGAAQLASDRTPVSWYDHPKSCVSEVIRCGAMHDVALLAFYLSDGVAESGSGADQTLITPAESAEKRSPRLSDSRTLFPFPTPKSAVSGFDIHV